MLRFWRAPLAAHRGGAKHRLRLRLLRIGRNSAKHGISAPYWRRRHRLKTLFNPSVTDSLIWVDPPYCQFRSLISECVKEVVWRVQWEWKKQRLRAYSKFKKSISALDFTYALANHRPELQLGKSVNQSATRIQMMSHHIIWFIWANLVKPFPAPQIFMTHSSPPLLFISIALSIQRPKTPIWRIIIKKLWKNLLKTELCSLRFIGHFIHSRTWSIRLKWICKSYS